MKRRGFAPQQVLLLVLLLLLLAGPAHIACAVDVNWTGPDNGNYATDANWTTQLGGHFVPDAMFNEAAAIGVNANNTTAVLSTSAVPNIGGVKLALGATNFGGLRIASGGTLNAVQGTGTAPLETGAMEVGVSGQGMLTILGGGTLNATSLTLAGANNSSITLGDATASTATLTTTGTASLGRTTTVVGPNVNFNANGNLTLTNTSTLVADIRNATTHSALKTQASAFVGGTLKPMFTGITPAAGNKWNLVDAATSINGKFSNIDLSMAPALPAGTTYQVISATNGARKLLQLSIEEVLVLQVNRNTGAVSIANVGSSAKSIDGYSILSPHGSLTGSWNSLDDQNVGGPNAWVESGPTANALSELNPGTVAPGSSTLNGGASFALGTPYVKTFPAFGVNPDDISFEYSSPDGQTRTGQVVYSGTKVVNNLVLTVDPTTGQAALKNDSPFTINVDGYSVYSSAGSLRPANGQWNSLQDQGVAGWEEAAPTANALAELKATGTLTLQPGTGFGLGGLFNSAGAQDLRLEFLQAGNEVPSIGAVLYGPFTVPPPPGVGLTGDYNNNGTVDAADYVLWRNGGPLMNDPTPGTDPDDYTTWRANFGKTSLVGAALTAAVPEPATAVLLLYAAFLGMAGVRRKSS